MGFFKQMSVMSWIANLSAVGKIRGLMQRKRLCRGWGFPLLGQSLEERWSGQNTDNILLMERA